MPRSLPHRPSAPARRRPARGGPQAVVVLAAGREPVALLRSLCALALQRSTDGLLLAPGRLRRGAGAERPGRGGRRRAGQPRPLPPLRGPGHPAGPGGRLGAAGRAGPGGRLGWAGWRGADHRGRGGAGGRLGRPRRPPPSAEPARCRARRGGAARQRAGRGRRAMPGCWRRSPRGWTPTRPIPPGAWPGGGREPRHPRQRAGRPRWPADRPAAAQRARAVSPGCWRRCGGATGASATWPACGWRRPAAAAIEPALAVGAACGRGRRCGGFWAAGIGVFERETPGLPPLGGAARADRRGARHGAVGPPFRRGLGGGRARPARRWRRRSGRRGAAAGSAPGAAAAGGGTVGGEAGVAAEAGGGGGARAAGSAPGGFSARWRQSG